MTLWGRSLNCRSPTRNGATLRGASHISLGARSVGCAGQLKKWATMWSAGVIGPAYGVAVGLEPQAVAGSDLGEGATVGPGQQLFGEVNWKGNGHKHFVGCLAVTGRSPLSSGLVGGV